MAQFVPMKRNCWTTCPEPEMSDNARAQSIWFRTRPVSDARWLCLCSRTPTAPAWAGNCQNSLAREVPPTRPSTGISLSPHFHVSICKQATLEPTTFLHPDNSKSIAIIKNAVTDIFQCTRERDLFDSAVREAAVSDALYSLWNLDASQILTAAERAYLDFR